MMFNNNFLKQQQQYMGRKNLIWFLDIYLFVWKTYPRNLPGIYVPFHTEILSL